MNRYKLVITEKPSVARTISAVLGARKREDGYYIGGGYIISWCVGHLAELSDAESYDEKYATWQQADLPILPEPWQYSVPQDRKKQLDLLCTLMHRGDVCEVINACDAGREGELIFRTVYNLAGCAKPMKRLWISSMEDAAIREGFANLRDGRDYDNLYAAALCRSKADWLVGINGTRLFSTLYHRTLNVGRVVSPTLALLVEREAEIDAFEPEKFYTVAVDCGMFTMVSDRFQDKAVAEALACDCVEAVVHSVEHTDKAEKAPALYDLTTLQRDANRIHGYTAQQTLDYMQSLYEKKLTTYPRTDSRYLPDEMVSKVREIMLCAAGICGESEPVGPFSRVCSSAKVTDHHAIIPTMQAEKQDLNALSAGERTILRLIARQVLMAVSPAYSYRETVAEIECGSDIFAIKGRTVTDPGWRAYLQEKPERQLLELTVGQRFEVAGREVREGMTAPPKRFTEDTLLSAMENAGANYRVPAKSQDFVGKGGAAKRASFSPQGGNERCGACDDAPADAERRGIGTPATRAGVIEKLVSSGFVKRKKGRKATQLIPAHNGISLVTVLPEQLQSPLLTAEWEHKLQQIERGEMDAEAFLDEIAAMVTELVQDAKAVPGAEVLFPSGRPVVGKCPRCGGDVTESRRGFFCERNECRFALWKDNQFFTYKKLELTTSMASALLADGKAYASGVYSERTGKSYDAYVVMTDDGTRTLYGLEFVR